MWESLSVTLENIAFLESYLRIQNGKKGSNIGNGNYLFYYISKYIEIPEI